MTFSPTKNASSRGVSNDCALGNGDWRVESEELATSAGDSMRNAVEYAVVRRIARLSSHTARSSVVAAIADRTACSSTIGLKNHYCVISGLTRYSM